jgi:hypothetical protein
MPMMRRFGFSVPGKVARSLTCAGTCAGGVVAAMLSGYALAEEEIAIEFGRGSGETRYVHFDDFSGDETWYMTRCQNTVSPDFYVNIRDYGDVEQIQPVNSPLEADKTVCVVGHIPDIVKRYMR